MSLDLKFKNLITKGLTVLGNLIVSGVVNFSSTTRPTSGGTGTPDSNSLITLADTNKTANRITVAGNTDSNLESTISTSGTNATVNVVRLGVPSAIGSTNVALLLSPKGTGAIIAGPMPDGTATGGNARGTNSFDFQTSRQAATQVASGANSIIIGGIRNTTSGSYSLAGGHSNTASGEGSVAIGGGFAAGYGFNVASGQNSVVIGGGGAVANRLNMRAFCGGNFAGAYTSTGDAQQVDFVLRCKTTTNSAVEMALDGSTTYLSIVSGKVMSGTINLQGIKSDGSVVAHYMRQFSIANIFRIVSSVDTAADTITFTTDHNLADNQPIRITSSSTMLAGLTEGAIYYAKGVNSTTISVHSATPVGAGNIMNITSAGAGTRYMSSTKLIYAPVTIGTDFASGTSIAIAATPVALVTDPAANVLTSDYLSILVTGIAAETWRWTAHVEAVETAYGT